MKIKIRQAAQEYLNRGARRSHPNGKIDSGGRWYPDGDERCECCNGIREPSRSYPWSLMIHCRTARHVANLYDVEYSELLKAARELQDDN